MSEYITKQGSYGASLKFRQMEAIGSVVICPGGAYSSLSAREAEPVARAFAKKGYMPFILSYDVDSQILGTIPLQQAGWAVNEARTINPGKPVFLCGFSAGGHLAASLGVHYHDPHVFHEKLSAASRRPDGLILCYPVITAGRFRHAQSIERLAGQGDSSYFSLENYVNPDTPPAFIWHTATDEQVPVENAILMAQAMIKAGVSVELMIYPRGVHGLSLATEEVEEPEKNRFADPLIAGWFDLCISWMDDLAGSVDSDL